MCNQKVRIDRVNNNIYCARIYREVLLNRIWGWSYHRGTSGWSNGCTYSAGVGHHHVASGDSLPCKEKEM